MENKGWRRLYIVRKDLSMSAGKLAAQLSHCSEIYWLHMIQNELFRPEEGSQYDYADLILPKELVDGYILGRIVKTVCQAKDLKHLKKAAEVADSLGLKEGKDYGFVNDACFTELKPENENGTCTTAIWFAPLPDEIAHQISKKYHLYIDNNSVSKEIVEKSKAKSPTIDERKNTYSCPNCGAELNLAANVRQTERFDQYCRICGQKLDWEKLEKG